MNPAHATESWALLRQLQRGELAPAEQVAAFLAMHARYPTYGWDRAARKQRLFFEGTGKLPVREPGEEG